MRLKLRIRAVRALSISKYAFKRALYHQRSIPRVLLKGKLQGEIVVFSNIIRMLYVIFPIRPVKCELDYQGFNAVQVIEFRLRQINHPPSLLLAG